MFIKCFLFIKHTINYLFLVSMNKYLRGKSLSLFNAPNTLFKLACMIILCPGKFLVRNALIFIFVYGDMFLSYLKRFCSEKQTLIACGITALFLPYMLFFL